MEKEDKELRLRQLVQWAAHHGAGGAPEVKHIDVNLLDICDALDRILQEISALSELLYLHLPNKGTSQGKVEVLPTESFAITLQIICDKVEQAHKLVIAIQLNKGL